MRRLLISLAFVLPSSLHAGVYNLDEFHPFVPLKEARNHLLRTRSASLPPRGGVLRPESFRAQILNQASALEDKHTNGLFTTLDRVNLSACYLRLGAERTNDALRLLLAADPQHFLVQSNLAAAYFLAGELLMAVRHQERALASWPDCVAGWSEEQRLHYRDCERALLVLYRSRHDESRRPSSLGNVDVDPLFPGVRYVGPSGDYQPGGIAQEQRDKLPGNAFAILYQLCLWFPTDMRLYWQLGEMLNALGAIDQASDIFTELGEAGLAGSFRGLRQHRSVLREAKPIYLELMKPVSRGMLLCELQLLPKPLFAPPIVGDAAYLAGSSALVAFAQQGDTFFPNLTPTGETFTATRPTLQSFEFRHLLVAFGFGFLVASLCGLQWLEWRRRRQLTRHASMRQPSSTVSRTN